MELTHAFIELYEELFPPYMAAHVVLWRAHTYILYITVYGSIDASFCSAVGASLTLGGALGCSSVM